MPAILDTSSESHISIVHFQTPYCCYSAMNQDHPQASRVLLSCGTNCRIAFSALEPKDRPCRPKYGGFCDEGAAERLNDSPLLLSITYRYLLNVGNIVRLVWVGEAWPAAS